MQRRQSPQLDILRESRSRVSRAFIVSASMSGITLRKSALRWGTFRVDIASGSDL
jgi:hypothetical protein